ncbi:hypothetical protein KC19_4G016500 [Ceratodon purpureus]|uniref:Uncharacterized protein n=1 Tax=Ceratodon purpureus TaxID=3225 RepID=A0A8T0I5I7_CERPU|nr:hypothetical protein KC19_4G016500 [Ceratodon purpureus]
MSGVYMPDCRGSMPDCRGYMPDCRGYMPDCRGYMPDCSSSLLLSERAHSKQSGYVHKAQTVTKCVSLFCVARRCCCSQSPCSGEYRRGASPGGWRVWSWSLDARHQVLCTWLMLGTTEADSKWFYCTP